MMTIWSACYRTGEFPNLAGIRCSDEDFIASEICSKNVTFPGVFIYCQVICKDRYKTSVIFWNIQIFNIKPHCNKLIWVTQAITHIVILWGSSLENVIIGFFACRPQKQRPDVTAGVALQCINIPPLHVEHRIHHWRLFAQVKSENIISRQVCKGKCIGIHNASMLIWSDSFFKHVNFKELFSCSQTKSIFILLGVFIEKIF